MRKTTMAMAFGLALSLGAAGAASAQSTQAPSHRDQAGQAERGVRGDRRGMRGMLFKGITLTADQKAHLKELRKNSVSTESREQFRKAMTEAREARQRGDTAAARAKMQAVRAEMEKNREREFATIRGILTPEQQRQFDANVAEMKQHAARRGAREGEGGRAGWRGEHGRSGK